MPEYRLARPAEAQIDDSLAWSQERFADQARERYAALPVKAMEEVAADPRQGGVSWRRLGGIEVGLYHIGHSREHVGVSPGRVGEPRHYVAFRVGQDRTVDILGFIHERMLLGRALRRIVGTDRERRVVPRHRRALRFGHDRRRVGVAGHLVALSERGAFDRAQLAVVARAAALGGRPSGRTRPIVLKKSDSRVGA